LFTTTYIAILGLAVLSGVTTLIGVALAVYLTRNKTWVAAGIGFSVGLMLLISLLELLPAANAAAGTVKAFAAFGLGMVAVAMLHWILPHTHLEEEKGLFTRTQIRSAYLVIFGLVLHDFPEGFAMANAYIASPSLGIFVAIGIALHNIPEEFAMAVPAVALKQRRLLFGAAVVSALAEPLGAVVGLTAVHVAPQLNPVFMGAAAGAMTFVSVHELIPMARRYHRPAHFAAGIAFSGAIYAALAAVVG
jgi:ZIP family zinc transporter